VIRNKTNFLLFGQILLGLFFSNPEYLLAQRTDSISYNNRKICYWGSYGLGYATGMYLLYQAWYKDYKHSDFHWFDDRFEWCQMDKAGHAFSSFHLAKASFNGLKWVGYTDQKARVWSSVSSFFTISSIELYDAYSAKWGASFSDLIANAAGSALFYVQNTSQRSPINLKFSFHTSTYAAQRPDALGKYRYEQILKDYNGQTYWLSLNLHDCGIEKIPKWLNLALGYSAERMINGTGNSPYRQYFLSLDFNAESIKTKNKWIKTILKTFNLIKFPFPAVEFSQHKFTGHGIYF